MLFFDAYPHALGGAQRSTAMLCCGLQERGWSVTVATPGSGPFVDYLAGLGIRHVGIPLPGALAHYGHRTVGWKAVAAARALPPTWLRLSRYLKGEFDVVHALDHRGQLIIGPAARLAGVPLVWHVHNIEQSRLVNSVCYRLADRTVVPARFLTRLLARGHPSRVVEIGNALPEEVLAWAERPLPGVAPRLLSVGRLHPQKGYETLLEAVRRLRDGEIDVECVIAGSVPLGKEEYGQELQAAVARLRLESSVRFLGEVQDVSALLLSGGVFVQASRWEVQPLALMEAMAAGIPVVATRVGGVPELIGQQQRGLLVEPEDPEGLAGAVALVLGDPVAAAERASAARSYITSTCRPDRMVEAFEALYRSL